MSKRLALLFSCFVFLSCESLAASSTALQSAKGGDRASGQAALVERPPELEGYGEHYDLKKYDECKRKDPLNSRCEIYRLKRKPAPEHWPYHKTSPLKWPDAPKETVYRPSMGPIDYWRALCKAEAGEFIYRTVQNVDAIYQIRPRPKETSYAFQDRYVMEDPYGYTESESGLLEEIPWQVVGPGWGSRKSAGKYPVFETPILDTALHWTQRKYYPSELFEPKPSARSFQRFSGYDRRSRATMAIKYENKVLSRYGWTWRGIQRPLDRGIGVAGGELAVVDLRNGELLALRRGFLLGAAKSGESVGWGGGTACPEYHQIPGIGEVRGRSKDFDFSFWFINKVLIPIGTFRD